MTEKKTIRSIEELYSLLNVESPTRIIPEIAVDIWRDLDSGAVDPSEFVGAMFWFTASFSSRGRLVTDGQMIRCLSGRGVYALKSRGSAVWGEWKGNRLHLPESANKYAAAWYNEDGYNNVRLGESVDSL